MLRFPLGMKVVQMPVLKENALPFSLPKLVQAFKMDGKCMNIDICSENKVSTVYYSEYKARFFL